ncbi:hypothetical protein OQA88_9832 [Cercophora sp. LCS_1]
MMSTIVSYMGPVARGVRCYTSLPLRRQFHGTVSNFLPRRRHFFTSNVFLQQDGNVSPSRDGNGKQATKPVSPAPQNKRKPPLKNSLHRVAIVAQKGVPTKAPASPSTTSVPESSTLTAVCVAESFDMDHVATILANHGFELDPDGTGFEASEVVHARGLNQGDIFVFPSGTVVTWALSVDVVSTLSTTLLLPAAEGPLSASDKEVEDLDFVEDPEQDQSRVSGDVVVIGAKREVEAGDRLDTTLAKIAFSSGLARSTKLAVLESSLMRYLESTRHIPDQLSQGLQAPLSRALILRKTGELLNLRSQLNHYNDLTDALPDIFWDSEEKLETYYAKIGKALDVGVRIKTLNDKMTYAQEVVAVAQQVLDISEKMSSEKHSTRLEWIIIILIAIEVAFELRRLYMERYDVFQEELLEEVKSIKAALKARQSPQGDQR